MSTASFDDRVISFDQSKRQHDKRLKDVMHDFDEDDINDKNRRQQKSNKKYDDDDDDICAMMDRFNK